MTERLNFDFKVKTLLDAVIVNGAGAVQTEFFERRTFQAIGHTSAGAGTATVEIQASLDPNEDSNTWITIGSMAIVLGTTKVVDGFASDAPWRKIRAKLSNLTGTGATVTVLMGT